METNLRIIRLEESIKDLQDDIRRLVNTIEALNARIAVLEIEDADQENDNAEEGNRGSEGKSSELEVSREVPESGNGTEEQGQEDSAPSEGESGG
jgi:hypothetical protein